MCGTKEPYLALTYNQWLLTMQTVAKLKILYIVVSLLVSSKAPPPLGVGRAHEVIA